MSGNHNSGRRASPTALTVLKGNPGRRPLNQDEPKPSPVAPLAPQMQREEHEEWQYILEQLDAMGTLAVSDRYVIEMLAHAIVDYRRFRAFLTQNGHTYEAMVLLGEDGTPLTPDVAKVVVKARPECKLMKEARDAVYRFSTLLGLDPSSRGRLHVSAPVKSDGNENLLTPSAS